MIRDAKLLNQFCWVNRCAWIWFYGCFVFSQDGNSPLMAASTFVRLDVVDFLTRANPPADLALKNKVTVSAGFFVIQLHTLSFLMRHCRKTKPHLIWPKRTRSSSSCWKLRKLFSGGNLYWCDFQSWYLNCDLFFNSLLLSGLAWSDYLIGFVFTSWSG